MIKTIWKERRSKAVVEDAEEILAEACGLTPLSAKILSKRGFDDPEEAMAYLDPDIGDFLDPFALPDMQAAAKRLQEAREKNEKICIYGDYDADGTTAVSMLLLYMGRHGFMVDWYIPNRMREGYGMNNDALDHIAQSGTKVLLTVDNGISAHAQADYCQELGMDLIITDHHDCSEALPQALAVVDAKRPDSSYPFRELCGAGIALKLIQALDQALGEASDLQEYIECAALATIADIVPLKSENRLIAALGIHYMNHNCLNKGIRALIEVDDMTEITAGKVGFRLAPRINAVGRLGDAGKIVALYTAEDDQQALGIAAFCTQENQQRQAIEKEILELALEKVKSEGLEKDLVIVVDGKDWHPGVIGIVASRILEVYYKPVIVIGTDEEGNGKGSCRSVEGFNMYAALTACKALFTNFGGHELAAGFSLPAGNIEELRQQLNTYAQSVNLEKYLIKTVYYDSEMGIEEVTETLVSELEQFQPCGIGNPGPVFLLSGIDAGQTKKMGKDQSHLMVNLPGIRAVGFGYGSFPDSGSGQFSILCKPEFNCFNGKKSVQLLIKDIKWSPFSDNRTAWEMVEFIRRASLDELPELGLSREEYRHLFLNHEILALIYKVAKSLEHQSVTVDSIVRKFEELNIFRLLLGLNVLREAELIRFQIKKGILFCEIIQSKEKKDIQKTPLMLKLKKYTHGIAEE